MSSYAIVGSGSGSITLTADVPCSTSTDASLLLLFASLYMPYGATYTDDIIRPQTYYPYPAPLLGSYDLCYYSGINWQPNGNSGRIPRAGGEQTLHVWTGTVVTDLLLSGTTLLFDETQTVFSADMVLVNVVGVVPDASTSATFLSGDGQTFVYSITSGGPGYLVTAFNALGFRDIDQCCKLALSEFYRGPGVAPCTLSPSWDLTVLDFEAADAYSSVAAECSNVNDVSNLIQQVGIVDSGAGSVSYAMGDPGLVFCPMFRFQPTEKQSNYFNGFVFQEGFTEGGVPYCTGESGPTGPGPPPGPGTFVLSTHLRGSTGPGET